jgi:hypothetical protein
MNELEKRYIVEVLRAQHRRAGKKEKGAVITELCRQLSVGRKHGIKLLRGKACGRPLKPGKRGRPPRYQDKAFRDALRKVWKTIRYSCGRTLHSAIPLWINAIEEIDGAFPGDIRQRLLKISPATIDRLLKPHKVSGGKSATISGGFREQIPIQGNIWNINTPGYLEADTAVMCGGSMLGEFVNTLTMVDIATIWTETRAVFGRGSNAVFDAIRDIEHWLPFAVLGYDADNGGEVLNHHLYDYFYTDRLRKGRPPVHVTRSREYEKNDNAHVEQRNDSLVRKFLGYERLEYRELVPLINYYYAQIVCPLVNHFIPCFKLADKIRIKSRTRRVYKAPVTPYQRLMESPFVSPVQKLKLKTIHESLNPVLLNRAEYKIRKLIDDCVKRLKAHQKIPDNTPQYKLGNALIPLDDTQQSSANRVS